MLTRQVDKGCFSLSRERALFTYQPDFFTKLNTCPSVHSYTYNNAYIITFRLWPKQPNEPKWPTLKIGRNDPPTKSETNHPLSLDETTQDKVTQDQNDPHSAVSHNLIPNKFLSMKLFPSFTEPVFVSYNFCLLRCRFVIWISWVKNQEPLVNGPAPLFPKR